MLEVYHGCDVQNTFLQNKPGFNHKQLKKLKLKLGSVSKRTLRYNFESKTFSNCFLLNKNKLFQEETLYMDRDSQMKAIEKTFEDNKKPVEKHYSKPNVHAVETLNVFPDFKVTLNILITVIELFK